MIIDLNVCVAGDKHRASPGCSGCLCMSCYHHIPFAGCARQHADCEDDLFHCAGVIDCSSYEPCVRK